MNDQQERLQSIDRGIRSAKTQQQLSKNVFRWMWYKFLEWCLRWERHDCVRILKR